MECDIKSISRQLAVNNGNSEALDAGADVVLIGKTPGLEWS